MPFFARMLFAKNSYGQSSWPWNAMALRCRSLSIVFLVGAIAACSGSPAPNLTQGETPSTDETADTPSPTAATAERVVTLTSLTADLVQTLDGETLVGIPGSPLTQQDPRFSDIDIVSEGRVEPDLEKIIALEPDLVIGAAGFHDKVLDRLQELGIDVLATEVDSWDALETLTEELAQRLDASPDVLLARYDACLAQAPESAPSTLVLVSRQPLLSPNKSSWAGDFLNQFNLPNLTADMQEDSSFGGYVTLSEEKVLQANPEQLLVVDTGDNLLDQLKGDAFWSQLAATQNDAVYTFDYFGLINPGSLASIEATCQQLANLAPED